MTTINSHFTEELQIFNKENVLICFNEGGFADKLRSDGYFLACTYTEFRNSFKEAKEIDLNQKQDKRKTKNEISIIKEVRALVVLCELNWGLSKDDNSKISPLSKMNGIDFAKKLRVDKVVLPILFVSFLNRSQQLSLSSKNEIISTPILGHAYAQLPSTPENWIELINSLYKENRRLDEIELEDVIRHFCNPDGMLSELKHDLLKNQIIDLYLRNEYFEKIIHKIKDILPPSQEFSAKVIDSLPHITEKEFLYKNEFTAKIIDKLISDLNPEHIEHEKSITKINVVFLDDELETDKIQNLIKKMEESNFQVNPFTNPNKAFEYLQNDHLNEVDLIISDYRIWDVTSDQRALTEIQGYRFLNRCATELLDRTYTYVVFSALDRNFLMTQIGFRTETLYKNGVLANEYSILNFISSLNKWAKKNQSEQAIKISSNKTFINCYNWYRAYYDTNKIEARINEKIIPSINSFNEKIKPINTNCCKLNIQDSCEDCSLLKSLLKSNNKIPIIDGYKSNYFKKEWDATNEIDINNLIDKFSARRLFFYYCFALKQRNCQKYIDIADNLIILGHTRLERGKYTSQLDTAKLLWINKTNLKLMPKEKEFLKQYKFI